MAATSQAEEFLAIVEQFVEDGIIPTIKGSYRGFPDEVRSYAQPQYYRWYELPGRPSKNFILHATVAQDNASLDAALAGWAGCGFALELALDPTAYIGGGGGTQIVAFTRSGSAFYHGYGRNTINHVDPSLYDQPGGVRITLILYAADLRFFVNDRLAILKENLDVGSGVTFIATSVLSGSGKDYGTRCSFSKMGMWTIE